MKMRQRARLMKQLLSSREQAYRIEEELFAGAREHRRLIRTKLTSEEEAFLSSLTASGEFSVRAARDMYASAQRLAREAERTLPPPRFRKFGRFGELGDQS